MWFIQVLIKKFEGDSEPAYTEFATYHGNMTPSQYHAWLSDHYSSAEWSWEFHFTFAIKES